ncbi:MAG: TonB-dependent receptor [Erythrobacter sp.]|uniref:TonB-dependent receptor domain-containing protein n=1 Tax=Erythrobacter sp. TaxID=1042 RepID=UPI00260ACD0D|nr:TonB-dependent receptor [Erythrobacter sp.]MDJ0976904.1 TonB-dependent receptor [Erythrobacter sp.]
MTVFVTGFWASTEERNIQLGGDDQGNSVLLPINRLYGATGIEFEGNYSNGPFSITVGATYTDATIDDDTLNPDVIGNTPRHIPDLTFFARPAVDFDRISLGAVVNGTTESFTQDTNILVQPGYTLVSPFVSYRPADNVTVGLNVFNVFDELAVVQLQAAAIPASGFTNAQVMNGRTVTASIGFSF